ncbi:MAG: FAD-binding oxidoreductase [Candidatus Lambdaproteobacteria bacterium]|nr:FAD-binding oxidoreductase [Candidatus Lambdaproteobacteria bacterium]
MNLHPHRPLRRDNDVVIVGGGIAGCAAAYYLARRGLKVTLLEKGRLAWEQSSRNWGFVRQQRRGPVETPVMVLGNRLWRELSAELAADIEWVQGGGLSLAKTAAELPELEAALAECLRHGIETRLLSRKEVQALIPGMEGEFVGGLYTPSDGKAHPLKSTLALAEAAGRHGAELHPYTPVEGFLTRGGAVVGVSTPRGEVQGGTVICAAGVFSRKLARMAGLSLPQRGVRASVAATVPLAPLTPVCLFGKDVCFRQMNSGHVYLARTNVGSADFDVTLEAFHNIGLFLPVFLKNRDLLRINIGKPLWDDILRALPGSRARRHPFDHAIDLEPPPNRETLEACRRAFMAHFPRLGAVALEECWAGIIDSTPDLLPVVGPVQGRPGFFFMTGFSGHGFAMGPPMGYLVAEWLAEGKPSVELSGMRFERFRAGALGAAKRVG